MRFFEIFEILYEFFEIFWNFIKFWNFDLFLQFDWPTGNEISSLVGQCWNTEYTIDKNRHKPEYTSREVYSLHERCSHSELELRKCCLGQSAKSKIPYHLVIYIFLGLTWLRCFAWFIVCFFLNLLWLFGFPNCLPHHIFVSVPSQDLDFQRQCRGLFCIYWFAVMVGYSFCQIFSYRCLKCFFFVFIALCLSAM